MKGLYYLKQKNIQSIDNLSPKDKAISFIGGATKLFGYPVGSWPGLSYVWGNNRAWLEPDQHTNTYGRKNFSIHGGSTPGSAGCIDLTSEMDNFSKKIKDYGQDITLRVYYPNDEWQTHE